MAPPAGQASITRRTPAAAQAVRASRRGDRFRLETPTASDGRTRRQQEANRDRARPQGGEREEEGARRRAPATGVGR